MVLTSFVYKRICENIIFEHQNHVFRVRKEELSNIQEIIYMYPLAKINLSATRSTYLSKIEKICKLTTYNFI